MKLSPRPLRYALIATSLTLPAGAPSVGAAPQKVTSAAAPKPATADNSIIALPLTPIVPAAQRSCAARTPSGLGYTMLRPAAGPKPAADATVLVNYIGYLGATGAVFDQGMQTAMPVGEVIPGFSQGLQMAGRGGIVRLCIPAALGYGAQASGPIPANADLVFQVEVVDFKTAAEMNELRGTGPADPAPPPSPQP
jgi:FKBP-type peptidyl-prolyl cis-trans isomerase FkpA